MQGNQARGKHKRLKVLLAVVLVLVVAVAIAFFVYTGIYYKADARAQDIALGYAVTMEEQDGYLACWPQGATPTTGFVFYPGGKVQMQAYLPYLAEVAQAGYFCVLLDVPFRLAILDVNAADKAIQDHPAIKKWAVGGHSLGGVAAATFAGEAGPEVAGLVLLASYASNNLAGSSLAVLSITATQDAVLNWKKYEEAKSNLPLQTQYVSIEGGNHSQFGMYGHQSGDGEAAITEEEQRAATAAATVYLLQAL